MAEATPTNAKPPTQLLLPAFAALPDLSLQLRPAPALVLPEQLQVYLVPEENGIGLAPVQMAEATPTNAKPPTHLLLTANAPRLDLYLRLRPVLALALKEQLQV
jgi:hypothetical protein